MTLLHMLDTDTASYAIRGVSAPVLQRLAELPPSHVCISVVTRAELLYGLQKVDRSNRLHTGVGKFLDLVRSLPWGDEAAAHYATIRHQLVSQGRAIGEMDMMIAAHAIALGAVLVSNNTRHFARIDAPLQLENWMGAG